MSGESKDAERIAGTLTPVPRGALIAWDCRDESKQWSEIKSPSAKYHSFNTAVRPLIRRRLVEKVRDSTYIAETGEWLPALYKVTPLGEEVRTLLTEGEGK